MDYKNTPEGRSVQSKYGKILHASRPEPPHNHPRMPMSNRAKELRIYTGFINDTGKELPTIIAFEDILEIGVNMT